MLITHDLGVIAGHAERICVMYAGKLVEKGTVDDVFYNPRMPYSLGLLGSLPRLDETGRERLTPIVGAPPSLVNLPPGCPFTPRCPLAQDVCEQVEYSLLLLVGIALQRASCALRGRGIVENRPPRLGGRDGSFRAQGHIARLGQFDHQGIGGLVIPTQPMNHADRGTGVALAAAQAEHDVHSASEG